MSLEKFIRLIEPTWFASRMTYPAYKAQLRKIAVLSGLTALSEAVALILIYFLIIIFTDTAEKPITDIEIISKFLSSPLAVAVVCGFFLSLAVKLKHAVFDMTNVVSKSSGIYAARLGLTQTRKILKEKYLSWPSPKEVKHIVLFLTKSAPFACGFAARGSAAIAIYLIQAVILCVILFYLSPLLTLFVLIVALLVITYLSFSFETVLESNVDRRKNMSDYRLEVAGLAASLVNQGLSNADYSSQVEASLTTGSTSKQLAGRLSERKERQTGSLVVEYVYPAAIIAISLMYTYLGDLAPDITQVALYFLLTRQVIISLYGIGKVFMSLSKHHVTLYSFMELMNSGVLPGQFDDEQDLEE